MTTEFQNARKPWIATSLSLLCTGLGQIYCGRVGRGIVMYSGALLTGALIVATAYGAGSTIMLVAFLACLIGLIGLFIWSVRDARAIARRLATSDYQLQEFNRPIVYTMMALTNLPYVFGLACFLRATTIEAFMIPSASMAPTFVPGDRILVTKLGLQASTLERGEVVVFRNPVDRRLKFVKRIIGLPGETVEMKEGKVFINGKPLEQTPTTPGPAESSKEDGSRTYIERAGTHQYLVKVDKPEEPESFAPIAVAPDAYFVLGDHRDSSIDSRKVGNVPHGLMIGVVRYLYLPGNDWKRFGAIK